MRYFLLFILLCLTLPILWINIALHSSDNTRVEQKEDVRLQLNFLETELKQRNLGTRMQQLFPEGYIFIHALYGLSWCELALSDSSHNTALKKKAIAEALYAYNQINSEEGVSTFQIELIPENGIFYCGWKNYLLSKILQVDRTFKDHAFYENLFKKQSNEIIEALKGSKTPYLESYSGQAWPADMFVAMASVANYNRLYEPEFKSDINEWLRFVDTKLDSVTKMIPHKVNAETGKTIQGTRGSSMGLSLRMAAEIDTAFGNPQYALMKKNFISTRFGLPAVREYPQGDFSLGDIDSGPVIFGVGFAATIATVGTMSIYGDAVLANQQYKTIHAFGFETQNEVEKKYLFGALPMADAFIVWGRASDLNSNATQPNLTSENWRTTFHFISLLVLLVLWLPLYAGKVKAYVRRYL